MIGLTATPASFIDRDTFRLLGCDANAPTFLYDYPQAVKEGFLVDFSLYQAHTSFQRKGIKGVDLSEEDRNALAEQGIDPDILDYAGTEIEVEVSNRDTLRKQWEEVMETCLKDRSGQLPGRTTSTRRPTTSRPSTCRCSCRCSTRDSRSSNVTFPTIPPRPFARRSRTFAPCWSASRAIPSR